MSDHRTFLPSIHPLVPFASVDSARGRKLYLRRVPRQEIKTQGSLDHA